MRFYDIMPGGESHYLCENGVQIARFDDLSKAEAVRTNFVSEQAEAYEKDFDQKVQI